MNMHKPMHPGELIKYTYIDPFDISQNKVADKLGVARSTFNRIIRGENSISPEMAIRLSKVLGRSPESWMKLQANYDLNRLEEEKKELNNLHKIDFSELPAVG